MSIPDFMADDPADVISKTMEAIRNKELEVFPSIAAKVSTTLQWAAPDLMPNLTKKILQR